MKPTSMIEGNTLLRLVSRYHDRIHEFRDKGWLKKWQLEELNKELAILIKDIMNNTQLVWLKR